MNKLSKEKYLELKYFCRQYNRKKAMQNNNTAEGRKAKIDVLLMKKIAADVAPGLDKYLIENIATGKAWRQINAPCGERQFYEARKKFFEKLSEVR